MPCQAPLLGHSLMHHSGEVYGESVAFGIVGAICCTDIHNTVKQEELPQLHGSVNVTKAKRLQVLYPLRAYERWRNKPLVTSHYAC